MLQSLEKGLALANERLVGCQALEREEARITLICVGEMCLNYKRLAFARWLYKTGRVNDNA